MSSTVAPNVLVAADEATLGATPAPVIAEGILERIDDGVVLFDRSWRIAYVNGRAAAVIGRSREELVGRAVFDLFPTFESHPFAEAYRAAVESGEEVTREAWIEGASAWYEVRAFPVPAGLLVVGRDVTAARRLEAERDAATARERDQRVLVEEASRMKDEFLTTLSHELRTPLNAIVGWAHMLQAGTLGPVEQSRAVETILRSARLQAGLIEDLLDISRVVTGKLVLDRAPVDVAASAVHAVDAARPTALARGVVLERRVAPGGLRIEGDPARVQQIFWNLLTNALKFTPRGGRVELHARRDGDEVVVEVVDDGSGIEPSFLPHLFERFRQGDASTTRHHGGLGLGLAITRHLVEAHGGTIEAESPGLGRGATFRVRFPALPEPTVTTSRRQPSPTPPAAVDPRPERSLEGARVLVVDDEEDTREMLATVLELEGAGVVRAADAATALAHLAATPFDAIVCDIGMPGEDGYAFIRKLRAAGEARGGWTPAIALTGYAGEKHGRAALLAGFQMHVTKPVEPAALVASIARLWRRHETTNGR